MDNWETAHGVRVDLDSLIRAVFPHIAKNDVARETVKQLFLTRVYAYRDARYKLKVFYQSRTGIPLFVGALDPEYFYNNIYLEFNGCIESYIQSEFGSGNFEVAIYDENNIELGRYSYRLGGAAEYVHPSEEEEDFDTKLFRMSMNSSGEMTREIAKILLAYHGYNMDELALFGNLLDIFAYLDIRKHFRRHFPRFGKGDRYYSKSAKKENLLPFPRQATPTRNTF